MTRHDLEKALEAISDAPDGIEGVRALVRKMALEGALVARELSDGSGTELYEQIAGRVPQPSGQATVPAHWALAALPDVSEYAIGKTPPTKESMYWERGDAGTAGTAWVSIGDMPEGGLVRATARRVSDAALGKVFKQPAVPTGTLLMSFKLTLGKVAVLGCDAFHNEAIISVTPRSGVLRDWLALALPVSARGGQARAAIKGATLNSDSLARLQVPLPPTAEQGRIVARVGELMTLCDEVEEKQTHLRKARVSLNDACLARLAAARNADEFAEQWGRIAENFDILHVDIDSVGKLKQGILTLALQGRLTPPSRGGDSIDELLSRIASERARLLKQRAARRGGRKAEIPIDPLDCELTAPAGWAILPLEALAGHIVDGTHHTPNYVGADGVDFISAKDIVDGEVRFDGCRKISMEEYEVLRKRCEPRPGDVLVTKSGSIGRVAVVRTAHPFTLFESVALVPAVESMNRTYLAFVVGLNAAGAFGNEMQRGVAVRHLHLKDLRRLPVPVPPREVQDNIVVVVAELFKRCDALIDSLTSRASIASRIGASLDVLARGPTAAAAPVSPASRTLEGRQVAQSSG